MGEKMDPECAEYLRFLGGRIKDVRKERGLTVRDMVVGHGYHESQWRRYEGGLTHSAFPFSHRQGFESFN